MDTAWETLKNEANAEMKLGGYVPALAKYEKVLEHCDSLQPTSADAIALHSTHLACLNNAGMAYLRLERYDDCIRACTKGIELDDGNLKARYRRAQAYYKLAHGESTEGKIRTTTTEAEADTDELWGMAMRDVTALLEKEPESTQAKELKRLIREARDQQQQQRKLIRKYGDKVKMNPTTSTSGGDAPGSVFQGFPDDRSSAAAAQKATAQKATGQSADGSYSTTVGGSKAELAVAYETAVAKDLAKEALETHAKDILGRGSDSTRQKAELTAQVERELESQATALGKSYGFLDPSWTPPTESESESAAPAATLLISPSTATAAAKAAPSSSSSSSNSNSNSNSSNSNSSSSNSKSSSSGSVGGGSFKDLLRGAKKEKEKLTGTIRRKIDSAVVTESLAALQAEEQAAASIVETTARAKEQLGAGRSKGKSKLSGKSASMLQEQTRLKQEPVVKSAWDELLEQERAAREQYRRQISSRPGGQVHTPKV